MSIIISKSHLKSIWTDFSLIFWSKNYIATFYSKNRFQRYIKRPDWLSFELTIDVRAFACACRTVRQLPITCLVTCLTSHCSLSTTTIPTPAPILSPTHHHQLIARHHNIAPPPPRRQHAPRSMRRDNDQRESKRARENEATYVATPHHQPKRAGKVEATVFSATPGE
jgi:hypothetical protein